MSVFGAMSYFTPVPSYITPIGYIVLVFVSHQVTAYLLTKRYNPEQIPRRWMTQASWRSLESIFLTYCIQEWIIKRWDGFQISSDVSDLLLTFYQSIAYVFVTDFLLYWMHRFLHTPYLFKYVHSYHHKITNPTAFDFGNAHPVEHILIFFTFYLATLVIPVHIYILNIYMFVNDIRSLVEHGKGWKLFSNVSILKEIYTDRHNRHHKVYTMNFGLGMFPGIYDTLFDTYQD